MTDQEFRAWTKNLEEKIKLVNEIQKEAEEHLDYIIRGGSDIHE